MGASWYCDACRVTIQNHRWHCTVCNDFDLCYECKGKEVPKGESLHVPSHEMTEHDCDQTVPALTNSDGVNATRVTDTVFSCGRAEPACTAEALCASCTALNASLLKNKDGAPVFRGSKPSTWDKIFCNRFLGVEAIPGSDGRCGPNDGPQCAACASLNEYIQRNSNGSPVFKAESGLFYCTRWKPDNTFCGPCGGEQCDSCKEFQKNPTEMKVPEPAKGLVPNELKFKWRRDLLYSLYKEGAITRPQFTAINKQNKSKLDIPPKLPGISSEVRLLFHMLQKDEEFIKNKVQILWDKYDTNKNGNLEFEEAEKFFADFEEASARATGKDVTTPPTPDTLQFAAVYEEIDTNKNGGVDFDEFFAFLKRKSAEFQNNKAEPPQVVQEKIDCNQM